MKNRMTVLAWLLVLAGGMAGAYAQKAENNYKALDPQHPISFKGDRIGYEEKEIVLGPKAFFVDGSLSEEEAARHPYVFRTFNEAAAQLTAGSEEEPMEVYIAPYVYWIDNPDDPAIRRGRDGREPFGLIVRCPYLHLKGLNPDPRNTVLASNRGQTQGAVGNFTMFDFWGDGLRIEDLTMGNYCNVDLEYPLKPELARAKRMSAITQAHVAYCHGDKAVARNVRFISRLNMNPLNGARRILFDHCHMESTDDALTGTGVYLGCTLGFYGQKPFWQSHDNGAVFLDCDFYVEHENDRQYFCKGIAPLSIVDCRYHVHKPVYAGWTHTPTDWLRCYQYNVQLGGQPYIIGAEKPYNTVCMEQLEQLKAFRLEDAEGTFYNTYNLLRGEDGWDPLGVKERVEAVSRRDGKEYAGIGTCLALSRRIASLQTGGESAKLKATVTRHGGYRLDNVPVRWKVQPGYEKYVRLSCTEGYECTVEALNREDETKRLSVIAYTDDGLECATELSVAPDYLPAPRFSSHPKLEISRGVATLRYELELEGREDQSLITWYRCTDRQGGNPIPVAVSRLEQPEWSYRLTKEDAGYYLLAAIAPKHLRCLPGEAERVVSPSPIRKSQVNTGNVLETDFRNFPCHNQPRLLPGFWTVDCYKPLDTEEYDWQPDPARDSWIYGNGINGATGTGLLQDQRGARLLYTPLEGSYGDMELTLLVDPSKTAGQGFGSATGQYMDLYIKFDTHTLTGYALRIIRTTKYSHAVDFLLMRYENGRAEAITAPISSTCYRTGCTLTLRAIGGKLTAHAETVTPLSPTDDPALKPVVDLEADIAPNSFGGTGIQHTGTCGESTTMLHRLRVEWK